MFEMILSLKTYNISDILYEQITAAEPAVSNTLFLFSDDHILNGSYE